MEKFSRSGHPLAEVASYLHHVVTYGPKVPYHVAVLVKDHTHGRDPKFVLSYTRHMILNTFHWNGENR